MAGEIPVLLSGLLFEKKLRCPPDSFKNFLVRVMSAGHRVASCSAIRSFAKIWKKANAPGNCPGLEQRLAVKFPGVSTDAQSIGATFFVG